MKIVVVTYGTEGDTRPLAALCRALMDAGHQVLLLADASTLGSATGLGIPSQALSGDIRTALQPKAKLSGSSGKKGGFTNAAKALAELANANTAAWMREVADATAGCDVIMASALAAFVALSVAEYRGIPAIGTGFIPITPTADFPSPFLPPGLVPRVLNRSSHRLVNELVWRTLRKTTNAARASVCGLPARAHVWTDHPMLYGVSPALIAQPQDWPPNALACGQWALPDPQWSPPPELEAFLASGEPPVYVGFGSMAGLDPHRTTEALIAAVDGRRALFYPGWSGVEPPSLPDNVFVVGDTPHTWLFPRTSMVVHHGGSGTSHSAARAGKPSVVVPFAGDQFFWADRLRRLGVADRPVNARKMDRSEIMRCIAFAERDEVRAQAIELGSRMSGEEGLGSAVLAVERLVAAGVK
ncbi:glycosyltransferase [Variovorax sp. J22R133]|uniref:glycosyltransferase n=1 Tax=Variovorax brevis TaxID=3053503 RepID=UPI00257910DD|nr:glycosyltransferase [Variovorax sp. J22R133]MDM0110832.1 glycosyltransferase [Variovorax sp. J22R133]